MSKEKSAGIDTYNVEGKESKVANYTPEPDDNRSIMEKLADLSVENPEAYNEAIDALIAEKGEDWFKNLRYDWSINGRPKQFPPQPMEKWRAWICLAGRGWGKDLSPLTPILTVNRGWITLDNILVGDVVFDEQGSHTSVTAVYDTNPEKCYRLHFSDGTCIEAGEGHEWVTWDRQDRKAYRRSTYEDANSFPEDWVNWKVKRVTARTWLNKEKVESALELSKAGFSNRKIAQITGLGRLALAKHIKAGRFIEKPVHEFGKNRVKTSQEIVETLYHELADGRLETNHCIPNTRPLKTENKILPIDPYLFGMWLGDGSKASGQIATHKDDLSNLTCELDKLGYKYSEHKDYIFNVYGLVTQLKELGVHKNKHIPSDYLSSSIDQRLSLLQGLMDSDGTADKDGSRCEFSQSNETLAKQVYTLIVSLGMSAHMTSRIPILNGEEKKENWRIRFTPNLPVFRLPRKLERLDFSRSQILKRYCRYIIKAEEIVPIPMRCITVDSPNSLYLAGDQLIPTHNTKTGAETTNIWVNTHKKGTPPIRIALIGATTSDCNAVMVSGNSGILSIYPDKEKPDWISTNRKVIWRYPDGEVKAIAECFALDINTEIPTPKGFKLMGDITVGEQVFDEKGLPCNVTAVTDTGLDHKCFEITFKNGQKITADAAHLWKISTASDRDSRVDKSRIVNSQWIADNFSVPHKGRKNDLNIWVKLTEPVLYEEKELSIAPYVLGVWLGDGANNNSSFVSETSEIPDFISSFGYSVTKTKAPMRYTICGLITQLKEFGLYRNKHIPSIYKQGSIEQRKELLRGLLDTDGFVSKKGAIVFSNTNEDLVDGVCEIVSSLGGWTTKKLQNPKKNLPYNQKPRWKVVIRGLYDLFKLPRKLERVIIRRVSTDLPVVSLKEVEPTPVRCITVDSSEHLFLATRSYIVTSNSAEEPERLRGPQFNYAWCLIGETPVLMENFTTKPLKDIKEGEYVRTRDGAKKVLASYLTKENADLYELLLMDGRVIIGTGEHPVYLSDSGFTQLQNIKEGDFVLCASPVSNSTEEFIILEETLLIIKQVLDFIERYGDTTTEESQKDIISTIKTRIEQIIQLKIWSASQKKSIQEFTELSDLRSLESWLLQIQLNLGSTIEKNYLKEFYYVNYAEKSLAAGQNIQDNYALKNAWMNLETHHTQENPDYVLFAEKSTLHQKMLKNIVPNYAITEYMRTEPVNWLLKQLNVLFVKLNSIQNDSMQDFVAQNALNLYDMKVVGVKKLAKKSDVYDLTIEDSHEFFANGVLVHNCDELAAWRYQAAWDMLMFGLRLGDNPQVIVTTTPRPFPILLDVLKLKTSWTTIGTTYENRSNLAPAFFSDIINKYEDSALGRQELMAEIIEEVPNAMWNEKNIEANRRDYSDIINLPEMLSMVIAIDPATTSRSGSAETGMCVAGYGEDDHFYIYHLDAVSMQPDKWATRALNLFEDYNCDKLIAEVNNGGDLVETVIKSINPMQKVYPVYASRGKITRAEPIAALYEQNRVHHIGRFLEGERQMTTFNPLENPHGLKDMVDALVWAVTWLVNTTQGKNTFKPAVGGSRTKLSNYRKIFNTDF